MLPVNSNPSTSASSIPPRNIPPPSAEQQRINQIASSTLSQPMVSLTQVTKSFTQALHLPQLGGRLFMVEYNNVNRDTEAVQKLSNYVATISMRDQESLRNTVETYAPLLKDELSTLKFLALESLSNGDSRKAFFYISIMNKIDPLACQTLAATAYAGTVLAFQMAFDDQSKINGARVALKLAIEANPKSNDLKVLSFVLRRIENPAEALLEGMYLIENNIMPHENIEIYTIFRENCHRFEFVNALPLSIEDAAFKNPLVKNMGAVIAIEAKVIASYFVGNPLETLRLLKKTKNYSQVIYEMVSLVLIKGKNYAEAEKWMRGVEDKSNRLLLTSYLHHRKSLQCEHEKDRKSEYDKAHIALLASMQSPPKGAPILLFLEICSDLMEGEKSYNPDIIMRMELCYALDMKCMPALGFLIRAYSTNIKRKFDPEAWNKLKNFMVIYDKFLPKESYIYKVSLYDICLSTPGLENDHYAQNPSEIVYQYNNDERPDSGFGTYFGAILEMHGQKALAKSLYEIQYEKTKDDTVATNYVRCLNDLNLFEDARQVTQAHLQAKPRSAIAHYLHAFSLFRSQEINKAMDHVTKGIALDPNYVPLRYLRAQILHTQKDYAGTIKQIERIKTKDDGVYQNYIPFLFDSYLKLNQLSNANKLLEGEHAHCFSLELRKEYFDRACQQSERELMAKYDRRPAEKPVETPPPPTTEANPQLVTSVETVETESSPVMPLSQEKVPLTNPVHVTPAKPEAARSQIQHLQKFSKHAVGSLSQKDRLENWVNNPASLRDACTVDLSLYPNSKPAAAPTEIKTKEYTEKFKLNTYEKTSLENASYHLNAIGLWLAQEKDLVTSNKLDAANYLMPRSLVYHVLKLNEALTPTGKNQHLISLEFEEILRKHIITPEMSRSLRHLSRHGFHSIDMDKLKDFCRELVKTTMLHNIDAFANGVVSKDRKSTTFKFANRHSLPVNQKLTHDLPIDYRKEALFELEEIKRVTAKLGIYEIDKAPLYKNGIKLAICAIEECLKQLKISHRELNELFYFGNIFAHEMSDDPKSYVNEEIPLARMDSIIKRADRIIDIIK